MGSPWQYCPNFWIWRKHLYAERSWTFREAQDWICNKTSFDVLKSLLCLRRKLKLHLGGSEKMEQRSSYWTSCKDNWSPESVKCLYGNRLLASELQLGSYSVIFLFGLQKWLYPKMVHCSYKIHNLEFWNKACVRKRLKCHSGIQMLRFSRSLKTLNV